jgi:hypothetical protein
VLPTEISADQEAEISPATAVESPTSTEQ